jgi:hypothetical protein
MKSSKISNLHHNSEEEEQEVSSYWMTLRKK